MSSIRQILLGLMALLCLASCAENSRKSGRQPEKVNSITPSPPPSPPPSPLISLPPSPTTDDNEDQDDGETKAKAKEIAVHATFLRSKQGAIKVVMALLAAPEQEPLPPATELKVRGARLTEFHVTPDMAELNENGTGFSTSLKIEANLSADGEWYCVEGELEKTKDSILTQSLGDGDTAASLRSELKSLPTTKSTSNDRCGL